MPTNGFFFDMQEVLVAADGESYERAAIFTWLSQHEAVSPTTGLALEHTKLVSNLALRNYIAGLIA